MIPPFTDNSTTIRWQFQAINYINNADIQVDINDSDLDEFIDDITHNCQVTYAQLLREGYDFDVAIEMVKEKHLSFEGDHYLELIYQKIILHHLEIADEYHYPSVEFSTFVRSLKRMLENEFGMERVLNMEIRDYDIFSFVLEKLQKNSNISNNLIFNG